MDALSEVLHNATQERDTRLVQNSAELGDRLGHHAPLPGFLGALFQPFAREIL